jgi:hypothetical protein
MSLFSGSAPYIFAKLAVKEGHGVLESFRGLQLQAQLDQSKVLVS